MDTKFLPFHPKDGIVRRIKDKNVSEKPHYLGHRQRLRDRFITGGADGLPDYELLELLLFAAKPRGDVKPLAKDLLKKFGKFADVITADPDELKMVDGVGDAVVVALKTAQATALRMSQQHILDKPVFSSWSRIIEYCQLAMGFENVEQFRLLFLDHKNRLIADEVQQRGTVNHTPVYPREILKRALALSASAIILVHNHPGGDATPSRQDIQLTQEIVAAAQSVGIAVHDHIIVAKGGEVASFKQLGLL